MAHFIVGLTGGISSGKTSVSDLFKQLDIDVIDADIISHQVTQKGQPSLKKIVAYFGQRALDANGALDRAWLREQVFANPHIKRWLEELLHPVIGAAVSKALASSNSPYTLLVSPLLIESPFKKICQRIVVVDIPVDQQLQRTLKRDKCSINTAAAIIQQQLSREQRLARADDIIDNSGKQTALLTQVHKLHTKYLRLADEA